MAEEKIELRDINYRQILPWTELFRGFQVALDPKKLLLASTGIVVMWFGWVVLSVVFDNRTKPERTDFPAADFKKKNADLTDAEADRLADAAYKADKAKFDLLQRTAGPGGEFRIAPWFENRGPNPYLMVTGQQRPDTGGGVLRFLKQQTMVLLEPLVKFFRPVVYLLYPGAGFLNHTYFLLILLWTLATWALFGGAITRMAAVQLARKEKITLNEAVRFTLQRYLSFFSAPLFPLLFVVGILVLLALYGFLHMIPIVGDIVVDGLGWPLVLLAGLVMAVILVGLVGWPLMYATISAEGSDSFDALSRSYSYVFQCPWHYIWNSAVAVVYGAVLVFFVGVMGSLTVYLSKWGVAQTPFVEMVNREPSYLFVYAPTSFDWRRLLLQGTPAVDEKGADSDKRLDEYINGREDETGKKVGGFSWWNKVGAFLVAIWLYLAFLFVIGFGYSYFWSASTIIYMLMRHKVDDTDMDEVYLEEDEEELYTPPPQPAPAAAAPPAASTGAPLQMVDAPTLKPAAAPPAPPSEGVGSPSGDGNKNP